MRVYITIPAVALAAVAFIGLAQQAGPYKVLKRPKSAERAASTTSTPMPWAASFIFPRPGNPTPRVTSTIWTP